MEIIFVDFKQQYAMTDWGIWLSYSQNGVFLKKSLEIYFKYNIQNTVPESIYKCILPNSTALENIFVAHVL